LKGLGVLCLLILLMMWLSGVFVRKVQPGPAAEKVKAENLKTWKVQKSAFPFIIEQTGTIRGQTEARVASRVMAEVKEILAREGQEVTGGEGTSPPTLLAKLDDRDAQARLRQAEAQLSAAEKGITTARAKLLAAKSQANSARANSEKASLDFRRFEALAAENAATRQQLDHTRAQRDSFEAQTQAASREVQAAQSEIERAESMRDALRGSLAEARASLADTLIYAPFSGKFVKKMVDIGAMASPGQPLFLIETNQEPELHAYVSESLLPLLKGGQKFEVLVDALHRSFAGVLSEIVPESDPATRTVLVKIGLPADPELVNGLFGRLRIPQGEYRAITVPADSVREAGQLHLVDILDSEGSPQRRFVTIGPRHDSLVEVLSGLDENDDVILP